MPLWKPDSVGAIIAERAFVVTRGSRKAGRVRVRFGQPVQGQGGKARDPWWCPVEVHGSGLDSFHPIAGIDSLQSLILALEFVTRVLPNAAERRGLRIEWLGDTERIVLARHALSREIEGALLTLFVTLRDTAAILASDQSAELRATKSLRRIVNAAQPKGARPKSRPKRKRAG
jgi:hypothetical protein